MCWGFLQSQSRIPIFYVLVRRIWIQNLYLKAFYIPAAFNRVWSPACRIMETRSAFPQSMARSYMMKAIPPTHSSFADASALPPRECIARIHRLEIESLYWVEELDVTACAAPPSPP